MCEKANENINIFLYSSLSTAEQSAWRLIWKLLRLDNGRTHTRLQTCRELEFLKFSSNFLSCETSFVCVLNVTLSCTCLDTENRHFFLYYLNVQNQHEQYSINQLYSYIVMNMNHDNNTNIQYMYVYIKNIFKICALCFLKNWN